MLSRCAASARACWIAVETAAIFRFASTLKADLAALDRATPAASNVRLEIARSYFMLREPEAALAQLNHWIASHSQAPDLHAALNQRCWARALIGTELEKALEDCNAALKSRPEAAAYLDSRGLVYLRMRNLDKAIENYTAALRLAPKSAWSLYGRGLARVGKGEAEAGNADIEAAKAIRASIADDAKRYGLSP